jgi:hypothetical protein
MSPEKREQLARTLAMCGLIGGMLEREWRTDRWAVLHLRDRGLSPILPAGDFEAPCGWEITTMDARALTYLQHYWDYSGKIIYLEEVVPPKSRQH